MPDETGRSRARDRRTRPQPASGPIDARRLVTDAGYRLAVAAGADRSPHLV
jgi:hypothetical protein